RLIEQRLRGTREAGADARAVVPVPRDAPAPLSYAQQRMWFIEQLEPGSGAYHITSSLRLRGTLNVAALEQAINAIVERHEMLRTCFVDMQGAPRQVIVSAKWIPIEIDDLGQLSSEAQAERIATARLAEWANPFDMKRGPLWR